MTTDLNTAPDIRHPRPAAAFLGNLADVFEQLSVQGELFLSNQRADGVGGEPIVFLHTMHEQFVVVASTLRDGEARAHAHCDRIADTVGGDESLLGTQDGGYADPAEL